MPEIVSSTFVKDVMPQRDGRFWVVETHIDVAGNDHMVQYLAAPDENMDARLAAHAAGLAIQPEPI